MRYAMRKLLEKFLLFFCLCQFAYSELYTSIYGLEALIESETKLIEALNFYIDNRFRDLKIFHGNHIKRKTSWNRLTENYDQNPIDGFMFIKRQFDSTKTFEKTAEKTKFDADKLKQVRDETFLPSKDDVRGAGSGLLRLQDTYELPVAKIAQNLTTNEAWMLASYAINDTNFYQAIPWLQEVESRIKNDITINGQTPGNGAYLARIYEYLAYAMREQLNFEWALWYTRKIQSIYPKYQAKEWIQFYEMQIKARNSTWDGRKDSLPPINLEKPLLKDMFPEFHSLCRGERKNMTWLEQSQLKCYLKRNTNFLKLAPIKVELLNRDPDIIRFREVISDQEITELLSIAAPKVPMPYSLYSVNDQFYSLSWVRSITILSVLFRDFAYLKRAKVINDMWKSNQSQPKELLSRERTAKHMAINEKSSELVGRLNRRVADMTDLSLETAEELQVQNYGLGGHYAPHYDMTTNYAELKGLKPGNPKTFGADGNRIGTVLFYLSEPQAGGATVFDEINLAAFPAKKDAIFWHNLYKNGNPDFMTHHGACPVLYGSKWVANKWIHERGNEFRRPCSLNEEE